MDSKDDERSPVRVSSELAPILPTYIDHRRDDVTTLTIALDHGDVERARRLGHQLKGTGSSYGLDEVSVLGARLEEAAKRNDLSAAKTVTQALADYLSTLKVVYDES